MHDQHEHHGETGERGAPKTVDLGGRLQHDMNRHGVRTADSSPMGNHGANDKVETHAGHGDKHAGHSEAMFSRLFWIALILTVPVVAYSNLLHDLFGYTAPQFPGSNWVAPIIASVIYWYTGWVFLNGSARELKVREPGMMTLVALAITSGYLYSLAVTVGLLNGTPFYWELATLVTIMLLGHWMELRAVGSASSALNELAKLLPDTAERVADGGTEEVLVTELKVGDLVLVRPGARVPVDGVVEAGRSQVDESLITGESRPVSKDLGDEVIGGSVNGSGSLRLRVNRIGGDTVVAGIMRLVEEAQSSRTRSQALADRAAFWLTFVAVGASLIAFVGWTLARGLDDYTIERSITTLVVACPHALGLAIPLVVSISTVLSARNGILVRDRMALERARNLDVVVFDKTGTLTKGEQGLVGVATVDGLDQQIALALAAAVEADSEHPIAQAIHAGAVAHGASIPAAEHFESLPGLGVEAVVEGRKLRVGGPRMLEQDGVTPVEPLSEAVRRWNEQGQTVVYLVEDGRVLAALSLADVIRPESREAIAELRSEGVRVAMLTGDSEDVAHWVATELNIDEYFAEVLPQHKSAKISRAAARGALVAMVGDGVNDAPALAQADIGIAIGAGTDVALASAGIVLIRNDPRDVARIIKLSRATYRKMIQNLAWAAGYNVIALPLAAGALAGVGVVMPVWVGAVLMSLSTMIVAINAQTLRRLNLDHRASTADPLEPASA